MNELEVKKFYLQTLPRIVSEETHFCDKVMKMQSVALNSVSSLKFLKLFEMILKAIRDQVGSLLSAADNAKERAESDHTTFRQK